MGTQLNSDSNLKTPANYFYIFPIICKFTNMYIKTYLTVFVALVLVEINALPQGEGNPKYPANQMQYPEDRMQNPEDRSCVPKNSRCDGGKTCCSGSTCKRQGGDMNGYWQCK